MSMSAIESLLEELTSSALDTSSSSRRRCLVEEVEGFLFNNNDDSNKDDNGDNGDNGTSQQIQELTEGLALSIADQCTSKHAQKRLLSIFLKIIHHETNQEIIHAISHAVCRLLTVAHQTGHPTLLSICVTQLKSIHTSTSTSTFYNDVSAALTTVWERALTNTPSYETEWAPALSLLTALAGINPSSSSSGVVPDVPTAKLSSLLLGKPFATPGMVQCARLYLQSCPSTTWKSLLPSCTLKLRANPDAAMATIASLLQAYTSSSDPFDWESDAALGDLVGILLKLLLTKKNLRDQAQRTLVTLKSTFGAPNAVLKQMVTAFGPKAKFPKAAMVATSADHRRILYETLSKLCDDSAAAVSEEVGSSILTSLSMALVKEVGDVKEVGLNALFQWMANGLTNGYRTSGGYEAACDFLAQPCQTQKANTSEFKIRMGGIFTHCRSIDTSLAIVNELWEKQVQKKDTLSRGLVQIVEASIKKHASSSSNSVVQLDGLLATYMLLLAPCGSDSDISLPTTVRKIILSGSNPLTDKTSFLFTHAMIKGAASDPLIASVLSKIIALSTKILSQEESNEKSLVNASPDNDVSASAYALAVCAFGPVAVPQEIETSVQTVLMYAPNSAVTAHGLLLSLSKTVNETETRRQLELARLKGLSFDEREAQVPLKIANEFSLNNVSSIRKLASKMGEVVTSGEDLGRAMVLMHLCTTDKILSSQRNGLEALIMQLIESENSVRLLVNEKGLEGLGTFLIECLSFSHMGEVVISVNYHRAASSLVTTLGKIAGNYDPEFGEEDEETQCFKTAWSLCIDQLALQLSNRLQTIIEKVEKLGSSDIGLYKSFPGYLFSPKMSNSGTEDKKVVKTKKMSEEEEWELQVKQEIARKKAAEGSLTVNKLSAEENKLLDEQTKERDRLCSLLDIEYTRTLTSVQTLCLSEIEVGNRILPIVSKTVLAAVVSISEAFVRLPQMKSLSFKTLCDLATCVYEIEEVHAPSLARALSMCCRKTDKKDALVLPSSCASVSLAVSEMYEYGECLSGNSFVFLFPILRAVLASPRSTSGCDDALKILDGHVELIERESVVSSLRKDIATCVLELLSYDRSKNFSDPNPTETLLHIYAAQAESSPRLSSSEISPLLGDIGSLGAKNCRLAAMTVLGSISTQNPRILKTNPLVENRIWLNCFAQDEGLRSEARKTWLLAHECPDDEQLPSPSKMFSVPLLPLLSSENADIRYASSESFASGIERHPGIAEKNLLRLLKSYVESYPACVGTVKEVKKEEPKTTPSIAAKPKPKTKPKPKLSTGLTAKKPLKKKKSSAIAALTTTRKKPSKSKGSIASLAPKKKERVIDKDTLAAQFDATVKKSTKEVEVDNPQKKAVRSGVIRVVAALFKPSRDVELEFSTLQLLVGFLIAYGLSDVNEEVRSTACDALRDLVATSGSSKDTLDFILPFLEASLKTGVVDKSSLGEVNSDKIFEGTHAADNRKEGIVIALGAAAIHLDNAEGAEKIEETINMLLSALSTPSESVQSSVALCLSKLMKKGDTQKRIEQILLDLIQECLNGTSLASRRGAAYGISAAVKGSGIASLKKFDIVKKLEEACSSGSATTKEGALFAIELLSARLGLLFEPYIIVLLPVLLQSFSDTSIHVRSAAKSSVGLVMGKLSGHGVKLLMPAVLEGLESEDWRTKQASIHMLGAMSHCAPKQLGSCLPRVVPKLTEAFSDTHPKVKTSAREALEQICKVIRNPEVSEISLDLLQALTDPSNATVQALESLIETEFLHAIDAPSLALIVPVLHRGLRDRAATAKRYGALIAGNICTMINDPRDFVPYLPTLLPDLKVVLLDPIPDCRSTSAKALGSLTRSLGEATFPELRPWLIETLKTENGSSVERSGAAQGLTEVLCAGGASLVDSVMRQEILPLISHPKASTREGVLWVLTFLPSSLGQAFAPLINSSFPALISGLSDENEAVREVAMRAGRVTIRSHGKAHVDKILPSLEEGLNDEDYRIRSASLNLLGDLLSTIGGTKVVKGDADTQDDIRQAERAQAQIALVLGPQIRKRVLSSLYLRRSDSTAVVRQNAVQVWKTVVSATPRTLRDILDALVLQIVNALASGHADHTQVAGRCLGDIVGKLGDTVLPEIIPVLRDALYRGDTDTRLGACVGLTEVIGCASREQISKYLDILVKVVQDALCDEIEEVRNIAASCFQRLYMLVGNKALDEIVPVLLASMESADDDDENRMRAMNGLTGILSVRSKELLPILVPRMLRKPITKNQAFGLGSICAVTGTSIHTFFSSIIPSLLTEIASLFNVDLSEDERERETAIRECVRTVFSSIDTIGVNPLICEIANRFSSDKESIRKESCWMYQVVIEERKKQEDFYEQIPIMLRELLYRLNDDSQNVLLATNTALAALSKWVSAEELVQHIEFIRNLISSMVSDARRRKGGVGDGEFLLPGFNMKKGLEPLLPVYQRGILYGNSSIREVSATGLGELIAITSNKYLAGPFIIKITGPLLRIVGDRNPSAVKIAIIQTLGLILSKGGPSLRAFVPQFQTTFFKALSDPSRQVRMEAIKSLALLMPLSMRVDPLIKELVLNASGNGSSSSAESSAGAVAIQTATLEALAVVLKHGGKKAKIPESIPSALDAGKEMLFHQDEGIRIGASKVVASASELLETEYIEDSLIGLIISASPSDSVDIKHGKACACRRVFASTKGSSFSDNVVESAAATVKDLLKDESNLVREAACLAIGAVLGASSDTISLLQKFESTLLQCLNPKESMDILRNMAGGLSILVRLRPGIFDGEQGLKIFDASLANAMSGNQRVQLAFNDFLWLALDVKEGDAGLTRYTNVAMFESSKKMKALYSKVLVRIKDVDEN